MAVLISGSNGGVGSAIARHLLEKTEHQVVLHVHSQRAVADALAEQYSARARVVSADLCDEPSVVKMFEGLTRDDVAVDGLVNCVGMSSNGMSWKLEAAEFQRIILGNTLPTFLCTKHALAGMRTRKYGRVVNISSVVGELGAVGVSHYGAAKAAMFGFTKCVAREVVKSGITVNALALGYMSVGIISTIPEAALEQIKQSIPLGRLGDAAEIGAAAAWLLSKEAAYLTGQVMHLNGGLVG
jgi:NAD(P)-dependent dehydrogenase (short-subunit alcohol dehydrogenase family)